jgi:lipoate-protein ligase B
MGLQNYLLSLKKHTSIVLLLEHPPTYTSGRRLAHDAMLSAKADSLGAEHHHTQRGGLVTCHSEGQLVVYPLLELHKRSPRQYVDLLQQTVIHSNTALGVPSGCRQGVQGVFVADEKIASVGVRVSRFKTSHGFSLNCNNNLTWFDHITACGSNIKQTSLSKQLQRDVTIHEVVPSIVHSFGRFFGEEMVEAGSSEINDLIDDWMHQN